MVLAMQRRSIQATLSPKLLKHFAAATVVMTVLIAIFASGEDWGAKAQIDALEAKNQLATTEAEKLGTKRVASTLKVKSAPAAASFGNDAGEFDATGSGSGSGFGLPPRRRAAADTFRPMVLAPTAADPGQPGNPPSNPGGESASVGPDAPPAPSTQALANITASSARRSGASGDGN